MAAAALAPATPTQSQAGASHEVRLAAAAVPPGGLITSFLRNQVTYCAAICPPLAGTALTAATTTLQTPVVFVAGLQSGDLFKTIGLTAASVTGPTKAALGAAIDADTTVAVPKASNTFEVGVLGLLNVVPAAAGGLPGIVTALQTARQNTFEALNLPIPVTGPTVMPQGVVQVAALGAIRVGEAIVFPAFNDVLFATVSVPDAAAQELAATGDPVRAAAAGVNAAVGAAAAAGTAVADSVVTAVGSIRNAAAQSHTGSATVQIQKSSAAVNSAGANGGPHLLSVATTKHASADLGGPRPLRDATSQVRHPALNGVKKAFDHPHRAASGKP